MCRELEAVGLLDPTFNSNTFILKTTIMSAAFEKSAVQRQIVGGLIEKSAVQKIAFSAIESKCVKEGYSRPTVKNMKMLYDNRM